MKGLQDISFSSVWEEKAEIGCGVCLGGRLRTVCRKPHQGNMRHCQVQPGTARYSLVQPGTGRHSQVHSSTTKYSRLHTVLEAALGKHEALICAPETRPVGYHRFYCQVFLQKLRKLDKEGLKMGCQVHRN